MTPFITLLQNRAENFPDFLRSGRSELRVPFPAGRKPASWGGRTEEMSRGAEPLGGGAARRRRRSGCGCMTPFPVRNTGCPCGNEYCHMCGTNHIPPATPSMRLHDKTINKNKI